MMRLKGWTPQELFQIVATGNSVTAVLEHLNAIEIDAINEEMRRHNVEYLAKWRPEFEARVARHERITALDAAQYGKVPAGYVPDPNLVIDCYIWGN